MRWLEDVARRKERKVVVVVVATEVAVEVEAGRRKLLSFRRRRLR